MAFSPPQRPALKAELLQQIRSLDRAEAILPSHHPDIDQLIYELEMLNPIQQPLQDSSLPKLLGSWDLVYASRGTVVTRRVNGPINLPVNIQRVWQRLTRMAPGSAPIAAENGAVLSIPLVGEFTAIAQGIWQPYAEAESANVSFGAFSRQPTRLWGITGLHLPKLTIPVLEFLRREALWITSYLDEDLRFGRGATGNLFVFCRDSQVGPRPQG
jgi:hypothetical protein